MRAWPLILTWLILVAVSACTPSGPPLAPVRSTLSPTHDAPEVDPELRVAHVAPEGRAVAASELTVVFNKPVRSLASPDEAAPPITIEPPVEGQWRWVGSRALTFVPKASFPLATRFQIEVPAGIVAVDGTRLESARRWTFDSPLPTLNRSDPESNAHHVPTTTTLRLEFDQPIDADALRRHLRIVATPAGGRPADAEATAVMVDFDAQPLDPDDPRAFDVVPTAGLPADAFVQVSIDELRPAQGSLVADEPVTLGFRTLGPLRVVDLSCVEAGAPRDGSDERAAVPVLPSTRCAPESSLELLLTNEVETEAAAALLTVEGDRDPELDYYGPDDQGLHHYAIRASFPPGGTAQVEISPRRGRAKLFDIYGGLLDAPLRRQVTFGDLAPSADLAFRGTYRASDAPVSVPVRATNVTSLEVSATQLTPMDVMARIAGAPMVTKPGAAHPLATAERNRGLRVRVPLSDLIAPDPRSAGPRGAVLTRLSYRDGFEPGGPLHHEDYEVQITDLAIFTRVSERRALAWVLDQRTGAPVAGARVLVHRAGTTDAIAQTTTDAQGRATLALPPAPPREPTAQRKRRAPDTPAPEQLVLFVERDGDWAYHRLDQPSPARAIGTMFTDRGLYRPGETVFLKGIVRTLSDNRLVSPAGETVHGIVVGEQDETVARFSAAVGEHGTFDTAVVLPEEASLGLYWVRVGVGDAGKALLDANRYSVDVSTRFQVAEYHPAEFEVDVTLDRERYDRGDPLTCRGKGTYLYGGPMSKARVRVEISRRATWFHPPIEDYSFDNERDSPPSFVDGVRWTTLDPQGRLTLTRTLDLPEMSGPEEVACEVAAMDLDNRALAAADGAIVHPADFYIGLRKREVVYLGEPFRVQTLAATPEGNLVGATIALHLERVERPGYGAPLSSVVSLGECTARAGATAGSCEFTAPKEPLGQWEVLRVRATSSDEKGRPTQSVLEFPAEPRPPPPKPEPPEPPQPPAPPELRVTVQQHQLQVGDRAVLSVRSPWPTQATLLLSIEADSVLSERTLALAPGVSTVELPITEAMVPEVRLRAMAVLGGDSRTVWEDFEVSAAHRELEVKLTPSAQTARPGAFIDVDVQVTDQAGHPVASEVTLWAADEGTLSLAMYSTPEPHQRINEGYRDHGVNAFDTRGHPLIDSLFSYHRTKAPQVRMGATSVSGREPRSDFRQTVLFEPRLRTDASGRLRHRVKLPDGLTEYRFMAVAVTRGEQFGSGEVSVTTNQPLMVRPSIPSVIRVGDRLTATAMVSTKDTRDVDVDLSIEVEGVRLAGRQRRTLHIEQGTPAAVQFELAAPMVGPYRVTLRADAAAQGRHAAASDAVTVRGVVEAPTFEAHAAVYGEATGPVAEALGDLREVRPDYGRLEVRLSTSRLVGLERGFESLLRYPYGCAEQTASRMLPLAMLPGLAQALGTELPADPTAMLDDAARRLASFQRRDGGFGFWSASTTSEPWLTAYVLTVLTAAKERGTDVDPAVLDAGHGYMAAYLADLRTQPTPSPQALSAAAQMVDLLAATKRPEREAAKWLAGQPVSDEGRALLLHALATAREEPELRARLRAELEAAVRLDGRVAHAVSAPSASGGEWFVASRVVSSALTLRALAAVDPHHPLVEPLARGLVRDAVGGEWRNTHETAWALVALDAYQRSVGKAAEVDAAVFLGNRLLGEHEFVPGQPLQASFDVPMGTLQSAPPGSLLTFDADGGGRYFYDALLSYAPKKLPTEPVDHGFEIERTMRVVAGATGAATRPEGILHAGDLVRVDVTVVTGTPRQAVALEIPLPGGVSPVDRGLGDAGPSAPYGSAWVRHELRDDRVLFFADNLPGGVFRASFYARARHPGRYVTPPARVFEMYAPEVSGATAASHVEVTP